MKRKIVKREYLATRYNRPGEGSVRLTLECGHVAVYKRSASPSWWVRCPECVRHWRACGH